MELEGLDGSAIAPPTLRVLDLFSGIGGFALAFEAAGFQTVAFAEIEPYPCKVLAQHWPDVPNLGDVRGIDGEDYRGSVDVVYGLWHFYRLVSGYRGSFIDLVMSFEGSIEIGSPASYVLAGVIAAIVVFLARMKPRPYYPVVPLDAEDEDKKPPNDGDRPAA
jgi:hypothetical protein